jgi:cytidyltransferase-like protein
MLVTFEGLRRYRGRVSLVDGAFDPIHAGHIAYFRAATGIGRPLLCAVAPDRYVQLKHPPLLPEDQRILVIDALRDIAYTHLNAYGTDAVLEQVQPVAYFKGKDWEGRLPARQVEICHRLGIPIVFLDTVLESSTRLLRAQAVGGPSPRSAHVPHAMPPESPNRNS